MNVEERWHPNGKVTKMKKKTVKKTVNENLQQKARLGMATLKLKSNIFS